MTSRQAALHLTVMHVLGLAAIIAVLTDAPRAVQVAMVTSSSVAATVTVIRAERPPRTDRSPRRRR